MENKPENQAVQQPKPQVTQAQPEASGINLLPEIAETEIKSGVYKRKVNLVALVVLGAIGVTIVVILILQGALALQANSIRNQTEAAEQEIQKNSLVEIKALATKEKLDKTQQLLEAAIPASTFVAEADKAAAASQIKLTGLSISQNGEAFVDGTASNSETFKQWVANLTGENGQEYFAKVNVVSLTGNPSEGYKFSIKLSFLKKGVYEPDAN